MAHVDNKTLTKKRMVLKVLVGLIGAFIMAFGLEQFLIPNGIMDGGIVGISIMISKFISIPTGVFLLLLNLPFIYIGYKKIGKTFAVLTAIGITFLSTLTVYLHKFDAFTDDPMLATVFGGMLLGVGVGLMLKAGGCLDGTEAMALIISGKTGQSVGNIIMIINAVIFGVAGFLFGWEIAMYSGLAYYIATKVIDLVVDGTDESKKFTISSLEHHEEMTEAIQERLGRTVTLIPCIGGYSKKPFNRIEVVVSKLEETKLKETISLIDKESYVNILPVSEYGGIGIKKDIH